MVLVGNINQSVETLLKTSNLFESFPAAMVSDSAFFDRMHCYIPAWEIPKYHPEFFTDDYGEQSGNKLIPDGMNKPGHIYTISHGKSGMIGVCKIETQVTSGSGKFDRTGLGSDHESKEAIDSAYKYLKANSKNVSGNISTITKDYLMNVQDLNGIGMTRSLTLPSFVSLCSVAKGESDEINSIGG